MTKPKRRPPAVAAVEPELRAPTEGEAAAIVAARHSRALRPTRVRIKVADSTPGQLSITNPHSDRLGWLEHLTDAFGTSSGAFSDQSLARIATAVSVQTVVQQGPLNAALALMGAINPQNELEAAIGEQIIAAHAASLDFMARARMNAGEYRDTAVAYAGMAAKLSRIMTAQVETLAKLRSGGVQTHEVKYIYVNGPAVFGDHAQAMFDPSGARTHGAACEKPGQSQAQIGHAPGSPVPEMRSEDAERTALQGSGGEGAPKVPDARRTGGRANREGERPL